MCLKNVFYEGQSGSPYTIFEVPKRNTKKIQTKLYIIKETNYCKWFTAGFGHEDEKVSNPANIYLFKVNNRNTRKRREICSNFANSPFLQPLKQIKY